MVFNSGDWSIFPIFGIFMMFCFLFMMTMMLMRGRHAGDFGPFGKRKNDDSAFEESARLRAEINGLRAHVSAIQSGGQAPAVSALTCPSCESPIQAGWLACPHCGQSLA